MVSQNLHFLNSYEGGKAIRRTDTDILRLPNEKMIFDGI